MNSQENIKKIYEQAKLDTLSGKDKAVLEKMKDIYLQESKAEPKTAELSVWRIIMKSNKTKLAAVAVIIIAVILSISLFDKSISTAYAVEQTIEAMHEVTTVHCFINLFLGVRMEVWVKVNPETGENEYCYMAMPGMEIISSPDETHRYNKVTNVVTHLKGDGHVVSDIRFGRFIEDMVDSAESSHSDVKFELLDIDEGKPVIILTIEDDIQIAEFKIDSETKLPISMNLIPKKELPPGQLGQSMEDFTYNEHLPEGIFDFEIPEGAQVIEQ